MYMYGKTGHLCLEQITYGIVRRIELIETREALEIALAHVGMEHARPIAQSLLGVGPWQ